MLDLGQVRARSAGLAAGLTRAAAARRAARFGLGGPLASPSADGGLEELEVARSRASSSTTCASSWLMRVSRAAITASLATISARSRTTVAAADRSGAPGAGSPGTPTLTVPPPSWSALSAHGRRRVAPVPAAGQTSHVRGNQQGPGRQSPSAPYPVQLRDGDRRRRWGSCTRCTVGCSQLLSSWSSHRPAVGRPPTKQRTQALRRVEHEPLSCLAPPGRRSSQSRARHALAARQRHVNPPGYLLQHRSAVLNP
jgi:hypothetical protein